MTRFEQPLWLLFLIVPLYTVYSFFLRGGRRDATILFSDTGVFHVAGTGLGRAKRYISFFGAQVAVILLIIALARPQTGTTYTTRETEGVDIILAMDISSSMAAMDFHPLTRFEASKEVVTDFIHKRTSDRIGLVVFAAQSFTMCPLTLDYSMLTRFLGRAWESRIDDGTAIGSAIATSVNRLRDSNAKSKIIILLTDGLNNRGNIDPLTAAQVAKTMNIKIYTIGVGSEGRAQYRVNGRAYMMETHIDEESLMRVSDITEGKYYRAKNQDELQGIYDEINQLETTKIEHDEWTEYDEQYIGFLNAGFLLIIMLIVLNGTLLRRIPQV